MYIFGKIASISSVTLSESISKHGIGAMTGDDIDIGANAFLNCSKLTSITTKGTVLFEKNTFDGDLYQVYYKDKMFTLKDGRQGMSLSGPDETYIRDIKTNTWKKLMKMSKQFLVYY